MCSEGERCGGVPGWALPAATRRAVYLDSNRRAERCFVPRRTDDGAPRRGRWRRSSLAAAGRPVDAPAGQRRAAPRAADRRIAAALPRGDARLQLRRLRLRPPRARRHRCSTCSATTGCAAPRSSMCSPPPPSRAPPACCSRASPARAERAAFALLLVALMMRWAEDPGRTDIAVAALLGVAALAFLAGRPVAAALAVAVGLFVHETGFVFGLPLLAGLWLDQGRWRAIGRRTAWRGAVLAPRAAALPRASTGCRAPTRDDGRRSCAATFRARIRRLGDLLRGQRRARRADLAVPERRRPDLCAARRRRAARDRALHRDPERRGPPGWPAALLVSVPPFLFLSVVANDISRWAVLAAFNVWLLCASARASRRPHRLRRPPALAVELPCASARRCW